MISWNNKRNGINDVKHQKNACMCIIILLNYSKGDTLETRRCVTVLRLRQSLRWWSGSETLSLTLGTTFGVPGIIISPLAHILLLLCLNHKYSMPNAITDIRVPHRITMKNPKMCVMWMPSKCAWNCIQELMSQPSTRSGWSFKPRWSISSLATTRVSVPPATGCSVNSTGSHRVHSSAVNLVECRLHTVYARILPQ